jgi:hypothetical protein
LQLAQWLLAAKKAAASVCIAGAFIAAWNEEKGQK